MAKKKMERRKLKSKEAQKRRRLDTLRARLWQEFGNHRSRHRELLDFFHPTRGRFTVTDANKGTRKNQRIINPHSYGALATLKSGMMQGITNPSTEWLRVTLSDQKEAEIGENKDWLNDVTKGMAAVFTKSNLYKTLPTVYGDMAIVAMGAMLMEEDFDDVVRFTSLPVGTYQVSNNTKGVVDTISREFRMTVRQLIEKFGISEGEPLVEDNIDWSKFSSKVKGFWMNDEDETWVDVVHIICPNQEYDPNKLDSKYKRYSSTYYERGTSGGSGGNIGQTLDLEKFLSEGGYDIFPVLCPRWETTGEDAYGTDCPAMKAEGQQRALQAAERRLAQADELGINPPLNVPVSLKKKNTALLPGMRFYTDGDSEDRTVKSVWDVNYDKTSIENRILRHQDSIDDLFFKKAFRAISDLEGTFTAFEIQSRLQEGRMMIGGALINIQDDLLELLVDYTFAKMMDRGMIPPAPETIQGQKLKVEFIGVLAQAQKSLALGGLQTFMNDVGTLAEITQDPTVWDKVNTEQLVDELAESGGVTPSIVVSDEEVAMVKEQRMMEQQALQEQEQMMAMAGSAKDLAAADMSGDNALTALTGA